MFAHSVLIFLIIGFNSFNKFRFSVAFGLILLRVIDGSFMGNCVFELKFLIFTVLDSSTCHSDFISSEYFPYLIVSHVSVRIVYYSQKLFEFVIFFQDHNYELLEFHRKYETTRSYWSTECNEMRGHYIHCVTTCSCEMFIRVRMSCCFCTANVLTCADYEGIGLIWESVAQIAHKELQRSR